jgi:hypothetical protein
MRKWIAGNPRGMKWLAAGQMRKWIAGNPRGMKWLNCRADAQVELRLTHARA